MLYFNMIEKIINTVTFSDSAAKDIRSSILTLFFYTPNLSEERKEFINVAKDKTEWIGFFSYLKELSELTKEKTKSEGLSRRISSFFFLLSKTTSYAVLATTFIANSSLTNKLKMGNTGLLSTALLFNSISLIQNFEWESEHLPYETFSLVGSAITLYTLIVPLLTIDPPVLKTLTVVNDVSSLIFSGISLHTKLIELLD